MFDPLKKTFAICFTSRRAFFFLVFFSALGLVCAGPVRALESSPLISPRDSVQLVSETDSIERGKTFKLGLNFHLTKGWHIYWLNPGDAGEAPTVSLLEPQAGSLSAIEWPTPIRLREGPAMVFAYENDVTLPFSLVLPERDSIASDSSTIKVAVKADWLVCEKSCVPESGTFTLSVPKGTAQQSKEASLFAVSALRSPEAAPFKATISEDAQLTLEHPNFALQKLKDAWFFPELWGAVEHSAAQTMTVRGKDLILQLKAGSLFKPSDDLKGILVLQDKSNGESFYNLDAAPSSSQSEGPEADGWMGIIISAFLGGLILNLMPCVFPILALKALALAKLNGLSRKDARRDAMFYTLGILVAFTFIDIIVLTLRIAGHKVGWGIQFQSPIFVTLVSWLLFALGLNLSGVFHFGHGLAGMGDKYTRKHGFLGTFSTGLLAVVVATPCVAPFVGAATAAALSASPLFMFVIFASMGLGLAFPHVFLAFVPGASGVLPRPGRWMEIFRQALAFPMYGASAWLLWVLAQQTGNDGLALGLLGGLSLALLAWLKQQVSHSQHHRGFKTALLGIVAFVLLGFLVSEEIAPSVKDTKLSGSAVSEEAYTPQRLAELRAEGKPVFVNMTAAWCLTCLVNEKVAISLASVQKSFTDAHVTYLKGDWTQAQEDITTFLRQNGRDGVPLYVFYPASHAAPVLLPQILTAPIIINAISNTHS